MTRSILIANRQRARRVNRRLFRQIATALLRELLQIPEFRLEIQLLGGREMTRVNECFLRHRGPTDVIAFDYRDAARSHPLQAEILLSVDEAVRQARRYRTSWQSELVRYAIHGVLHLQGFADKTAQSRRKMKRAEDRLLKELERRFRFALLELPEPGP